MLKAKKEYIEDHNAVLMFVREMFEPYDPDNKTHFYFSPTKQKVMKPEFKIDSTTMYRYFYYFMR